MGGSVDGKSRPGLQSGLTDLLARDPSTTTAPAGSDGVLFLPWLLGSIAPSPNDDVRAGYVGLSLHHDRHHLLRATRRICWQAT